MQVNGASAASAVQSGVSGIQRGQEQLDAAAQNLASRSSQVEQPESSRPTATADEGQQASADTRQSSAQESEATTQQSSTTESLVQSQQAERQVEASAQVVETADDALGSIIDVRA